VPAGGEVEGVVVIDLLQEAAAIGAHDLDRDADFASDCWMKVAPKRDVLAPGRGQQPQREARAARAGLEAGLVEQRDRELLVEGILRPLSAG
jgi:hypothetical protein